MKKVVVADSSYIVVSLLDDASLLETDERLLSPDIAFYEVINAIWKQQVVLRQIVDARRHIDSFMRLMDSGKIVLVKPESKLVHRAYDLAVAKKVGFYDTVFIALARDLNLELKTFDKKQAEIFRA